MQREGSRGATGRRTGCDRCRTLVSENTVESRGWLGGKRRGGRRGKACRKRAPCVGMEGDRRCGAGRGSQEARHLLQSNLGREAGVLLQCCSSKNVTMSSSCKRGGAGLMKLNLRRAHTKLEGVPTAARSATSGAMGMSVRTANTMSAAASARRRSLMPLTSSWMYCSAGGQY